MNKEQTIQLFEEQKVRMEWDDVKQKWFFSIVDVCGVLTGSKDPQAYWRKLKQRLKDEGNETVTNCHALKMKAQTTCHQKMDFKSCQRKRMSDFYLK